jgi:glycerol-3-phosphate dehydrogenase (NAD(P)+)
MNIGVIGAGSWGTTLANLLAKNGLQVTHWAFEADLVERMTEKRENDLYLKGFQLSKNLSFTNSLPEVAAGRDLLLLVPPSQLMRSVLEQVAAYIDPKTLLVSASKGIENDTLMLMSEVLQQVTGIAEERMVFLSGPTFAHEVSAEQPSAAVAASCNLDAACIAQETFSTDYFRVYTHDDIIGVELGGALKNVMALAAGVSDGLGFGYNTRAALITRGLAEMNRLGQALGANPLTFAGLTGMGDLMLTCTGDLSRNRTVGIELGRGKKLNDILAGMNMVAEGVKTTLSAYELAQKLGVEAPIIEQMYQILYRDKNPLQAVSDLMLRKLKPEV